MTAAEQHVYVIERQIAYDRWREVASFDSAYAAIDVFVPMAADPRPPETLWTVLLDGLPVFGYAVATNTQLRVRYRTEHAP